MYLVVYGGAIVKLRRFFLLEISYLRSDMCELVPTRVLSFG
jgi:hypothetical protein